MGKKKKQRLNIGDHVRIKGLHKIETLNPEMKKFIGKTGVIVKQLPREWKDVFRYGRFRVKFDDPKLTYTGSEGVAYHELNFFPNELVKIP